MDMTFRDDEGASRVKIELVRYNAANGGPMAEFTNLDQGVQVEDGVGQIYYGFNYDEGAKQTFVLLDNMVLSGDPPTSFEDAELSGTFLDSPLDTTADGTRQTYCPSPGDGDVLTQEGLAEAMEGFEGFFEDCGEGTAMFVPVIFLFCGLARFHRHR